MRDHAALAAAQMSHPHPGEAAMATSVSASHPPTAVPPPPFPSWNPPPTHITALHRGPCDR